MSNEQDDFASKVVQSLLKNNRAVDISGEDTPQEDVQVLSVDPNTEIKAFGQPGGGSGGTGPATGGNKDIVILPGFGGAASTSASQINFYWNAPTTPDLTGIGQSIRTTIFNFAASNTQPQLVIGGWDGTVNYVPTPTYGSPGGVGTTAKIFIDPFFGSISADYHIFNSSGTAATQMTTAGFMYYDPAQNKFRGGTGAATAKTFAFTDDVTAASGLATTASNIQTISASTNSNHFILFSPQNGLQGGVAVSSDADLLYNPSTNVLTSTFSGNLTGNVTGFATTGQNVNIVAASTNTSHPIVFTPASGTLSGAAASSVSTVTINPSTSTVSATTFSGAFTGNVTGFATTGQNVNVVAATTNSNHPIMFTPASGNLSGAATSTVSSVTVNPSTATITATTFTGNLTGIATTATQVNVATTNTASTVYPVFSGVATTVTGTGLSSSGSLSYVPSTGVLTATTFSGAFSGNLTGNVTGFATTGQNVNVIAASTSANHPILFTPATGTVTGTGLSSSGSLSYVPSTGVLTATSFSGAHTGNLTGFATTGQNVNVVAATTNSNHQLMFTPASGTLSGAATSTVSTVTVNPSTATLTATTFVGALTGTASTATNLNVVGAGNSNLTHYVFYTTASGNVSGAATSTGGLTYNPSTATVSATTFSGSLSGYATTGQNINIVAATTNTNHPITFTPATGTVSGAATSSVSTVTVNPSTSTVTATTFAGTLSGNATTSTNVNVVTTTQNATHYFVFTPASGSVSGAAISSDSTVTLNPSTNAMSLGSGNLTANNVRIGNTANTVDTSSGNLTLDSTGGTTNINDNLVVSGNLTINGTTITVDSTISTLRDPIFVLGAGLGGTQPSADDNKDRGIEFRYVSGTAATGFFGFQDSTGKFTFIPNGTNTNEVFTGTAGTAVFATVEGNLLGNVFGNVTGNLTGNVTGFATTGQNVNVVVASTSATHSLLFSPATTGVAGAAVSSGAGLTYNPNTQTLYATNIVGTVTGTISGIASSAYNISVVGAGNSNLTHYLLMSTSQSAGSGAAVSSDVQLTYNPSTDVLTATTFSGNLTGTATTGQNINVVAATTNANHPITFTPATGTVSGAATSSVSTVTVNPSTGTVAATTFSGAFTGNLTGIATTATMVNVATTNTASTVYPVFSGVATTVTGTGLSSSGSLSYVPSTGILTATSFSGAHTGNLTGFATTGQNVNVIAATTNTAHPIMFTPASGSLSGAATSTVSTVTVNPSTGTVAATTFSGAFTGNLTGNVTGFATTGQNVNVVAATTNTNHPLMFTPASGSLSGAATSTVSTVTVNPSTSTITATTFSGAFTGNLTGIATTATMVNVATTNTASTVYPVFSGVATTVTGTGLSSSGSLSYVPSTGVLTATSFVGNLTGYATTGQNVNVVAAGASNLSHYLMFTTASTSVSGAATSTISTVSVNPSTGTITATTFSGSFSGYATTSNNVNVVAATTNANHPITFTPATGTVSGAATSSVSTVTVNPSTSTVTATTFAGSLSGSATTATQVNVATTNTASTVYPVFSGVATTVTGTGLSSSGSLSYVPSTGILTATSFSGSLTGNVTGFATTGQNVNIVSATTSGTHYLMFTPASGSVTGAAVSTGSGTGLTVNPNTGALTSGPQLITSTSALGTGTYLTIQTNSGDDSSTADFFIRGLTSVSGSSVSKFSVDANGNLRATTKSFDIEHPTKPGMRLVYGVLEGPEHGVYHRGTVEGKGVIKVDLPEYWFKLVGSEYTINLTTWGNYAVHIVEKTENYFTIQVNGDPLSRIFKNVKVDFIVHGSRLDAPLKIEQ